MNFLLSEQIEELRRCYERGDSLRKAARDTGINRGTVHKYFLLWKSDGSTTDPMQSERKGRAFSANSDSPDLFCRVSPAMKGKLIDAAAQRNVSLNGLVGFLLEVIVEDNLIPAIMDETGDDDVAVAQPVKRKCMCCEGAFFSAHKFNRLCRECTQAAGDGPGDPAVDYVSNGQAIFEGGMTSRGRMGGFVK